MLNRWLSKICRRRSTRHPKANKQQTEGRDRNRPSAVSYFLDEFSASSRRIGCSRTRRQAGEDIAHLVATHPSPACRR